MKIRWTAAMLLTAMAAGGVSGAVWILMPHVASMVSGVSATTGVPAAINHQGVVTVNGARFNGTGLFKFAIVDPDTGFNRWTNDGTALGASSAPTATVSLSVTDGVYSVRLGSSPMQPVPAEIFADDNLKLRIWFDDGVNGSLQMSPDHTLTSVPYALAVADGVVSPAKLSADVGVVPAGTVVTTARATAPAGWLLCNGSAVSRTTYAALFAAIGTAYGAGDGSTTFNLPDMRDRSAVGVSGTKALASTGGAATVDASHTHTTANHTLTTAEIPAHSHTLDCDITGYSAGAAGAVHFGQTAGAGESVSHPNYSGLIGNAGGGGAHNHGNTGVGGSAALNVQNPYVALNYMIKF